MTNTVMEPFLELANPELVATIADLVPRLRELAPLGEERRWIDDESLKLVADTGLLRAMVPKKYGGMELPVGDQIALEAQLGRADASLAWVHGLWLANSWVATQLPDKAQDEIFADPDACFSGVFQPSGSLTPVDGGYLLNGGWKWNTGCRGSVWDSVGAVLKRADGPPEIHYCTVRTDELTIIDNWNTSAAAATASCEVRAKDVFVPHHRTTLVDELLAGTTGDRSNTGATGRNYPLFAAFVTGGLGMYLGVAQGAYELFLDRLPGRGITYTPWSNQSASPVTQVQVATAANKLEAAKALTARVVQVLQDAADRGEQMPVAQRAAIRGHCGFVVELCRQSVQDLYQASGASVIMSDIPMQRFFRDINGLALHAGLVLNSTLEVHGRVAVGLDAGTPFV